MRIDVSVSTVIHGDSIIPDASGGIPSGPPLQDFGALEEDDEVNDETFGDMSAPVGLGPAPPPIPPLPDSGQFPFLSPSFNLFFRRPPNSTRGRGRMLLLKFPSLPLF